MKMVSRVDNQRYVTEPARAFLRRACGVLCLLAMGIVPVALAEVTAAPGTEVGKVSLVLGKATISGPGRAEEAVQRGTVIRVSDKISTEGNGHVHIRFVDDALVSVRPHSLLEIVRYDYDQQNPTDSSIKLNLLDGVSRSISGDAARSARQRFRMDTPIAAIGVRGTDFVVSASERTVRAVVNEGAIVVAPYSSECRADALGPCALDAVELTENTMQLVEMAGDQPLPRLLPVPEEELDGIMREEVAASTPEDNDVDVRTGDEYQEAVTVREVSDRIIAAPTPSKPKPPAVQLPDMTPGAQVAAADLTQNQLVWGRYSEGQGSRERISVAIDVAKAAGAMAVGNGQVGYFLTRQENGSQLVRQGLGQVGFNLASAQAFLNSTSGASAMRVDGGSLDINFDSRQYATVLRLDHSVTGRIDFTSSGTIERTGFFNTRSDTQTLNGAVSIDGSEAAYLFQKQLNQGTVSGLTLWGRP